MSTIVNRNGELIGWLQLVEANATSFARESRARFNELKNSFSQISYAVDRETQPKVLEIFRMVADITEHYRYNQELAQKTRFLLGEITRFNRQ